MIKDKENSILEQLFDSIRYFYESKSGKYSLDTYLDIVGEYSDRLIKESEEKDKLMFLGGDCKVINDFKNNNFDFSVRIYFENAFGEKILKEARRSLPKSRFTTETDFQVGESKKFEIHKPE